MAGSPLSQLTPRVRALAPAAPSAHATWPRRLGALLAALLSALSVSAWGQEPSPHAAGDPDARERARELYYNGETLYEEGQYEAAILAFEEAYRLSGEPLLLFNIANAYERMGELEQTIDYLTRYRAFAQPEEREALSRRVRNLERRLEAGDTGTAPLGPSEGEAGGPDLDGAADDGFGTAEWVLAGVAASTLATGVVFSVIARERRQNVEDQCVAVASSPICPDSAQSDYDAWRRSAITADVGYGLAVASTVALVVLLVTSPDGDDDRDPIRLSVGPTGATPGGMVRLLGRF